MNNSIKHVIISHIFLIILLFCTAISAADLPRIAVYVTGDVDENQKMALGTRILASLVRSGRYMGIERGDAFIAEIEREHTRQRSGAIDDAQISALGRQFGVKYVCIANINPVLGSFQVSARIVDVETAAIIAIGQSHGQLQTIEDLIQVSNRVVLDMFGVAPRARTAPPAQQQPSPEPAASVPKPVTPVSAPAPANLQRVEARPSQTKKLFSVGAGGTFMGGFGGRITWSDAEEQITMPYMGIGAYIFFDAEYIQTVMGFHAGGAKWHSRNVTNLDHLPHMSRAYINLGVSAKYPIIVERSHNIKIFPILGVDGEISVSGKLKYKDGNEYPFDGGSDRHGNSRPGASSLSAIWLNFGGGSDIDLSRNIYLRAQLLYGVRTVNAFEKREAEAGGAEAKNGHGMTARGGVGIRF